MEGDRRLIVRKPMPASYDSVGQPLDSQYEDIEVYGRRRDRSGIEATRLDSTVAIGRTSWRIRSAGIEDIDPAWKFQDDRGRDCNIIFVSEPSGPFQQGEFYDVFVEQVSV